MQTLDTGQVSDFKLSVAQSLSSRSINLIVGSLAKSQPVKESSLWITAINKRQYNRQRGNSVAQTLSLIYQYIISLAVRLPVIRLIADDLTRERRVALREIYPVSDRVVADTYNFFIINNASYEPFILN